LVSKSNHPNHAPQHYAYLDALRGWAILAVIAHHCGNAALCKGQWPFLLSAAGARGVQLFFAVSAITLLMSMDKRSQWEQHPVRNFFVRRFFRIAPLFWAGIVFYSCIPTSWCSPPEWLPIVLSATFLFPLWPPAHASVVPGGWSIGVEMCFYAIFPLMHRHITSMNRGLVALLLATIAIVPLNLVEKMLYMKLRPEAVHYLEGQFRFYWFPNQFLVFVVGFVAYFAIRQHAVPLAGSPSLKRRSWIMLVLALYLLFGLAFTGHNIIIQKHFTFACGFGLLAWALSVNNCFALVNPVTRFIGKISYSMYIWHFALIDLLGGCYGELAPWFPLPPGHDIPRWTCMAAITFALAIPVSYLSYRFIEEPGMAIGKRLIRKLEASPT